MEWAFALLIARRLWQLLPIIVFATFVVFSLLQLVPGDPALALAGDYASKERIEEIRKLYGFDQPLIVQYGAWLWHVVHGDLGKSLLSSAPVLDLILQRHAEHDPDRDLCAGACGGGRHSARRAGGDPRRLAARRVCHQRRLARRRAAELLAGDPAGGHFLARPATGSRRPARARSSPTRGAHQARDPAGGRARRRRDRRTRATGPQRADRSARARNTFAHCVPRASARSRCCGSTACAMSA